MAKRSIGWALAIACLVSIVSPAFAADTLETPAVTNGTASKEPGRTKQFANMVRNTLSPKFQQKHAEKLFYQGKLLYHVTLPENVAGIKSTVFWPNTGEETWA
jgi:hypothetical protein